jgi:hypothetical protein
VRIAEFMALPSHRWILVARLDGGQDASTSDMQDSNCPPTRIATGG